MKNKKQKIFLIPVIATAIIIGIGSGYFFYNKSNNHNFETKNEQPSNNNKYILQNYLTTIFNNEKYENDYYYKQMKELNERLESEKSQEKEQEELAKQNGTESPYYTNFYSSKKEILDVKGISKNDSVNYSESLASTMLLNYYGINITYEQFISKYLTQNRIVPKDSPRYSVNPENNCLKLNEEYYSNCFAPSLKDILQEAFEKKQIVRPYVGMNLNYMIPNFPAIVWVGKDYQEAKEIITWKSESEQETYTYPKNSTAILMVGYDQENFYIIDPMKSSEIQKVNRTILAKSYDSYGRQSIGIDNGRTGLFK